MTFREYLMEVYIEIEHPLDDMISDGFPEWLDVQDIEDILDWADLYAQKEVIKGQKKLLNEVVPNLEEDFK